MCIGVLLARKNYEEGGCPVDGVIISNETRQILGRGHKRLVQRRWTQFAARIGEVNR